MKNINIKKKASHISENTTVNHKCTILRYQKKKKKGKPGKKKFASIYIGFSSHHIEHKSSDKEQSTFSSQGNQNDNFPTKINFPK